MKIIKRISLLLLAVFMLCGCSLKEWIFTMEQGEKPVNNPYKGFVAWGENYREDDNVAFAYVPVYWWG